MTKIPDPESPTEMLRYSTELLDVLAASLGRCLPSLSDSAILTLCSSFQSSLASTWSAFGQHMPLPRRSFLRWPSLIAMPPVLKEEPTGAQAFLCES